MPRSKLLAVDPGLLTGMAFIDISDRMAPKPLAALEADPPAFFATAESTITKYADDLVVVCENFLITERTAKLSQAPWSLMYRGVLEFLCWKHSVPFVLQTPQETKAFASDDKLKKTGFWHVGGEGHANDAYRHAMKYHSDRNPRWTNLLLL